MGFPKRVEEADVAKILRDISDPPNIRKKPSPQDLKGRFDSWFDGGAVRNITGYTEYEFADGTRATVVVSPILSVTIEFPNGSSVGVLQKYDGRIRS